jgi:hypothetical protein
MSLLEGHPRNRMRHPDWRWRRAFALHEHGFRVRRVDDEWTRRAFRIQKLLKDHDSVLDHRLVVRTDPPVLAAYRLRYGDPRLSAETNARLLADQPFEGITARTGVPADVVTAYEKLFYNVTDALAYTDWIAARCFRPRLYTDLREDDADVIMGWFGYCFGPEGLDDLVDSLYGGSPGGVRAEGSGPDTPEAGLNRALIAALTLPNEPGSERRVLKLASRMEQIDREHANRSAGLISEPMVVSDRIVDSIAAVLATESKADIAPDPWPSVVDHRVVSRFDEGYEAKGDYGPSERRTA